MENQIVYILRNNCLDQNGHRNHSIAGIYFTAKQLASAIVINPRKRTELEVKTMYANKINNQYCGVVWNQISEIVDDPELFEGRVQKRMNDHDMIDVRGSL